MFFTIPRHANALLVVHSSMLFNSHGGFGFSIVLFL